MPRPHKYSCTDLIVYVCWRGFTVCTMSHLSVGSRNRLSNSFFQQPILSNFFIFPLCQHTKISTWSLKTFLSLTHIQGQSKFYLLFAFVFTEPKTACTTLWPMPPSWRCRPWWPLNPSTSWLQETPWRRPRPSVSGKTSPATPNQYRVQLQECILSLKS